MTENRRAVRWTSDLHAVHDYAATEFEHADSVQVALGSDTNGDYLEWQDLSAGIAWRAWVTDTDAGRWAQDVWLLPPTENGLHDRDTSRLALPVAMAGAPTRHLVHYPHRDGGKRGTVRAWWWKPGAAGAPHINARETYWELAQQADIVRILVPWEKRFGLRGAFMHAAGPDVLYAEAHHGPYRVAMSRTPHTPDGSWVLTITDTHPTTPDEPAPHRWTAAMPPEDPNQPQLPLPFADTFALLVASLTPVDEHTPTVPREIAELATRTGESRHD